MPDWTVSIQSTIFFINVSVNVTEFAVSAHFFVSFVSIHVYLSVPLNSITRCDYNVFGTTLPSISCLIFSLGPPNRCACMDVSSVCVCVGCVTSAIWQGVFDGGQKKGLVWWLWYRRMRREPGGGSNDTPGGAAWCLGGAEGGTWRVGYSERARRRRRMSIFVIHRLNHTSLNLYSHTYMHSWMRLNEDWAVIATHAPVPRRLDIWFTHFQKHTPHALCSAPTR